MSDDVTEETMTEGEKQRLEDKPVLIRVKEWVEWLPSETDPATSLSLQSGYAVVQCGASERVLDVAVSGMPGRTLVVTEEVDGREVQRRWNPYGFQATLATNVTQKVADMIMEAQRPPMPKPGQDLKPKRNRADDLVLPPGANGNRAERRGKGKKR